MLFNHTFHFIDFFFFFSVLMNTRRSSEEENTAAHPGRCVNVTRVVLTSRVLRCVQ